MSRNAVALGLVDLPGRRSSHAAPTPRGGGIGLLFCFVLVSFPLQLPFSFWLPATLLALVSFFDDRLELSPKLRLLFQFVAAAVVIVGCALSWISVILLPFWLLFIVATANFYNFMDGINGIAGLTGVVGFGLLAIFTGFHQSTDPVMLLSLTLVAACAGFLPFNLPQARVFMGDVGSVLLGFVFACLVFLETDNIADFICLVSFFFPFYADTLTTLFVRWRDRERLSQAHRRHLYQLLCNELGLPHWQVACGYSLVQLLIGGLMLFFYFVGIVWQGVFLLSISLLFVFISLKVRAKADQVRQMIQ